MTMPSTVQNANNLEGQSSGFEAALTWQSFDWWRWRANYTYLTMDLHTVHGSTDTSAVLKEKRSPKQQAMLWWSFQPSGNLDLDVLMRYTDKLEERDIPAYWGLDLRIAYRYKPGIEIAIVGQNLLDSQHQEFTASPGFSKASEIPRSVYGKLTMRF
jgi:iron complex outermembrane receptor protein